ncbi:MAG: glycosyltransferase family 1 protein [ANME-2 cluster archaeon]|nr:MAG: glycosyltransferase family 1 protein [ANME-2 cluster archaeon]
MRIGYFITHFPYKNRINNKDLKQYHCGGAEVAAYNLAIEMAKRGHDIYVFTTSANSKNVIEKHENIKIYRYSTNCKLLTSNISSGMFRKTIMHDVDVIHTHFDIAPGPLAGLRYAKKRNVPLIITYHGDWVASFGGFIRRMSINFHNKYLVDKILSYADVIISPSEPYINESRFLRNYRNKIIVIPNGINLEEFNVRYSKEECREKLGLPLDRNILLYFSFLSPYKGPDVLIKAMPKIIEAVPNTELIFAGKGVMRNELEKLSKSLKVETNVRFSGFVEDSLKPLYFKAADVFVLPSTMNTEVFPLVLLEASASKLPMVVSDLDTFKCLIKENYNGLLTRRNDKNDLADAIINLLENEEIRKEMGKKAREKVQDYSWEKISDETMRIYQEVLQ